MDLAKEILDSVTPTPTGRSWFANLPQEHQDAVLAVREQWRKTSQATGISASRMAQTIIKKLDERGHKTPKFRQVQRWLTQG